MHETVDGPREISAEAVREWLESLDAVIDHHGLTEAGQLLQRLTRRAEREGVQLPFTANTPYINTIPPDEERPYPGDRDLEQQIKSLVRWNALAMVVRANHRQEGIGGHISTYASAATLYEVGFNHFFRATTDDFTLTNLGGLGGTSFTPIVNHPEVAILGLSRSSQEPVLVDQEFEPRLMMPLSLSYDHRLIDGADAVRFLRFVAVRLEQPLRLSLSQV